MSLQTTGIVFPLILTPEGTHTLVSEIELIVASIKTIISWPLYTRFFLGIFGSRVEEVLEEQNDDILILLIKEFIIDAISKWEQRIELVGLEAYRPTSEKLTVELTYKIKTLNTYDSLSYTFYTN